MYHIAGIFRGLKFHKFRSFGAIHEILTMKIFIEYEDGIIDGRVIILANSDTVGIMDVALLLLARQYLICPIAASQTAT